MPEKQVVRGLKFRIYPNKNQKQLIDHNIDCCRFIYNSMLARNKKVYSRRKEHLSYNDMQNLLPKMKLYLPWLAEADSQALKYACRCVDTAYQKFFAKTAKYPKFHSKKANDQSYTTTKAIAIRYRPGKVKLPKLDWIKAKETRNLDGKVCSATVTRHNGKYYVSITYKKTIDVPTVLINESQVIGLDYKSDGLYVDSNAVNPNMPKYYRQTQQKLAKEQRKLRNMQGYKKGQTKSNRFVKQNQKIANLQEHIANQRRDFLEKKSTELANVYDAICVEDLNLQSIANKGFGNGKATLDNGYGMFLNMLQYKLAERGKQLVVVEKYFASSQICHCCGQKHPEMKDLKVRTIKCSCGYTGDRDVNAAINIRNEGLRILFA